MDYKKELSKLWQGRRGDYQKLTSIEFNEVGMRGVKEFSIEFRYPITAIAGANGIGKTTILQVAACLFHNTDTNFHPYRFSNAKKQNPNYRFTDFFVISRGENKGLGAEIKFLYEKPGQTRTEFSVKKNTRWTNYERRPDRYVDFLGISRVLPAHEFATFRNTFSGNYTILTSNPLNDSEKQAVGKITGKKLADITEDSCSSIQNFKLSRIEDNSGLKYSSFNMGAGEEVAIALISRISNLPEGSLILIEEIELGLHPRAQKELIKTLMKIVLDQRLQLIFTTHSPFVFDVLPPDAKILLKKPSGRLEAIYAPSNSLAFIELTGTHHNDLTIYVEDEIAKQLVENLFNASTTKRVTIIDVGSKENVIRMTSAHYINIGLGSAIGIGDGDLTGSEIRDWCKKYMLLSGDECDTVSPEYFCTLPSSKPPEIYILDKMRRSDDFIKDIDDSDDFEHFIKNELNISDDHHALFYLISDFLSKDEEGIKRDILRYVSKNYKSEFQAIIDLVTTKLEDN